MPNYIDKLKPCPFCGGSAVLQISGYDRIDSRPHDYAVCCTSCGASTRRHFPTLDEAVKAWDKRADTVAEYPEYLPQVELDKNERWWLANKLWHIDAELYYCEEEAICEAIRIICPEYYEKVINN